MFATIIASEIMTFASAIAMDAFIFAGMFGSLGVGIGIFAVGVGVGLAYNKLVDSIDSLKNELRRDQFNIDRCQGLLKTITLFKYLTFGFASKSIDQAITRVAFSPNFNNVRSYNVMRFLIEGGIKPNNSDLYDAVRCGNGRLVSLLIQNGCNPNPNDRDLLSIALNANQNEVIAALIENGVKIEEHHLRRDNIIEHIIRDAERHFDRNEKEKVNSNLLNSILSRRLGSSEEQEQVQNLLNNLRGNWAGEIGPILAKGQVPVYHNNDQRQEILGHRDAPAMQEAFRNPGTMSHIASFLDDKGLGRTKSVAKPEIPEVMPSVQNNDRGGDSASAPQSIAIDMPPETPSQGGGGASVTQSTSPSRSHAQKHGPRQKISPTANANRPRSPRGGGAAPSNQAAIGEDQQDQRRGRG